MTTADTRVMMLFRRRARGPGASNRTLAVLTRVSFQSQAPRWSSGHRHALGEPPEEEPRGQGEDHVARREPEEDRERTAVVVEHLLHDRRRLDVAGHDDDGRVL